MAGYIAEINVTKVKTVENILSLFRIIKMLFGSKQFMLVTMIEAGFNLIHKSQKIQTDKMMMD